MKNWRVYEQCEIEGNKFAILVNDETKEAKEVIWDKQNNEWTTDFSYWALKIDMINVAEMIDFNKCRKEGYNFIH